MKFYKEKFKPITNYEEMDRKKTINRFEYSRVIGYLVAFLTANNLNKIKSVILQKNVVSTNYLSLFTKSFCFGLVGFLITHCISLKIMFSHTEYVRLRLHYEKSINFDRNKVKENYEDYPFSHRTSFLYNDLEVRNKMKKKIKVVGTVDHGEDSFLDKKKGGIFKSEIDEEDESTTGTYHEFNNFKKNDFK